AQNTGAAFGLLPERTTLLSVLSVVAVRAIVYYYRRIASNSALVSATLGMQLGGAFGNLLDRVTQGYVVDFVDVGLGDIRFWAFNVTDSSIVVGIFVVTIALWYEERQASPTEIASWANGPRSATTRPPIAPKDSSQPLACSYNAPNRWSADMRSCGRKALRSD